MKIPKAILFDFWNTLVRTSMNRDAGIRGLLELAGNPQGVSVEQVREVANELIMVTKPIRAVFMEFTQRQFDRNLFDRMGLKIDITDKELDRSFIKNMLTPTAEPGAVDMLKILHDSGFKVGVVSNSVLCGDAISSIMAKFDMRKYVDFVMTSADYGFRKPHPQIFKTAQAKIGCDPDETWFVGDWIRHDIVGAQAAGMTGVWYNPNSAPAEDVVPDIEIKSLLEIIGKVRANNHSPLHISPLPGRN